jgi:gamma-glutamyltranspeptidase/glutathione hydrolase
VAHLGARAGFYEGEPAERLRGGTGSPLVADDFARYAAFWVEPIQTTYRGLTVLELPPNTQGFAALQVFDRLLEKAYADERRRLVDPESS